MRRKESRGHESLLVCFHVTDAHSLVLGREPLRRALAGIQAFARGSAEIARATGVPRDAFSVMGACQYSQMKLQTKGEALPKLNRKANEGQSSFNAEKAN